MYTADNTTGYTQVELDRLNRALQTMLDDAYEADPDITPDEIEDLTKAHAEAVARR